MTTLTGATTLKLSRIDGYEKVTIPYRGAGAERYLIGIFYLAWLGGWGYGEVAVLTQIIMGEALAFHAVWLIAWTVVGIIAASTAFRLLRPAKPETFTFETNGVRYDRGVPPPELTVEEDGEGTAEGKLTSRRLRTVFTPAQLRTLNLRETRDGNRLTIEVQADRLELARGATEPEREWLFETLTRRYA